MVPKPTNSTVRLFNTPAPALTGAMGMEAEVLPYLSTFTQTFSIGIFKRLAQLIMRILPDAEPEDRHRRFKTCFS